MSPVFLPLLLIGPFLGLSLLLNLNRPLFVFTSFALFVQPRCVEGVTAISIPVQGCKLVIFALRANPMDPWIQLLSHPFLCGDLILFVLVPQQIPSLLCLPIRVLLR